MQAQPSQIDVQDFLNEQPFSNYQWLVFTICLSVVLLDGFDTTAIGYLSRPGVPGK